MSISRNKYPIKKAFNLWINNCPESFHPLDMERFYVFVKTVCRYSRKPKGSEWLRRKIKQIENKLSEEKIEIYCNKFEMLQEFHKAKVIPIYGINNK